MDENTPNLAKDINLQIQEAEQISKQDKSKKVHAKTYYN